MDRFSALIVIPCFNEANRLCRESFVDFLKSSQFVRFLFVDDGSNDATVDRLFQIQRTFPQRIDVHRLQQNQGKGEAVRQGMLIATQSNADWVGFWDADLATPLAAIDCFIQRIKRSQDLDVIIGCRLPLVGHQVVRPWHRMTVSRIFAGLASRVLGTRFRDTQCGAKLFRNTSLLESCLQNRFSSPWIFDVELLARLTTLHTALGQRQWISKAVYELPLDEWRERDGTKLKLKDFLAAPLALAKLKWLYSGRRQIRFINEVFAQIDVVEHRNIVSLPNVIPFPDSGSTDNADDANNTADHERRAA